MKFASILSLLFISLSTCNKKEKDLTSAEKLIFETIDAHGGERYDNAYIMFTFREKNYTFKNVGETFEYTVSFEKDGKAIHDILNNEGIVRSIDGKTEQLTEKQKASYSESLNSVIYFATLPNKLRDKAVNKEIVGETKIKGEDYDVVEITFNEEGGGKDYDDTFHYWINQKTKLVDYLAYNYSVGKGGVRFRSAYNQRVVGGILFQDYINYKANIGTALFDLPKLWEEGKLEELSRIETEDVKELRN